MNRTHRMTRAAFAGALMCLPLFAIGASTPPPEPTAVTGNDVDNTRINQRDRDQNAVTPTQQRNDKQDIQLAAAVRKAIERDKSLSASAHNVKLVASNGRVTLRGPVKNAAEKDKVERIVQGVSGVAQVQNDLDVKTDESKNHKE